MDPIERFLQTAKDAGCPRDQVENFMRAGVVLQPKQLQLAAAARLCDTTGGPTEIGFGGARGGGKSHATLAVAGCDDCQRVPGLKGLLLRKIGIAAKEGFNDLRTRVLSNVPHRYVDGRLTFENGSSIVLGHFNNERDVDRYLGLEYDFIILEEATQLSQSKFEMIRTVCRSSKTGWRPRMYLTWNPGGIGHGYIKKRFVDPYRRGEESGTRFIPATVDDNIAVGTEYVTVLDELTGWRKRAWRYGDMDIEAGQFFTNWLSSVHEIQPFELPPTAQWYLALDYGWTHWTAITLGATWDGKFYIVDETGGQKRQVVDNAAAIQAMLDRNGLTVNNVRKCVAGHDIFSSREDRDKGSTTIEREYREHGFRFEKAVIDRVNGAGNILTLLGDPMADEPKESRLFVFNRCSKVIDQIPAMIHDPSRPEDVLKVDCDDDGHGGDDFYDSARYLLMAMRTPKKAGWGSVGAL